MATEQRGQRIEGRARAVQMNEVKFRAPSAHPRHPWFIRKVWWRWLLRQPRSAPLGNWIHRGKILRKPELHPQTWKDNVPTVLPDVVSLPALGSGGQRGSFFGKYQISSPPASPLLHSQIQPDRVLPTGLRRGRNRRPTVRLLYSLYK